MIRDVLRRDVLSAAGGLAMGLGLAGPATAASATGIRPGAVWLDTAGKPIQAHGGSILQVGDLFYWYGENKERTKPGSGIWHWGVRAYSSRDLIHWTDVGLIIPPDTEDQGSPLHPARQLDRPHILHNRRTGKFVCWVKIMETDGRQTRAVLTADQFTGPYTIIRRDIQILGMNAGDFDLLIGPDGRAYQYFERVHSALICADLSDDYVDLTGEYSSHFPHPGPPLVREAPAYFRRNGKHYLITSGTTGYHPNPKEVAMADTLHGPWTVLGDLHPSDRSRTSFNSQISSVFQHPSRPDLYIALADRWLPNLARIAGQSELADGSASRRLQSAFGKVFSGNGDALSAAERAYLGKAGGLNIDSSVSTYVWLPLRFEGDRPFIDWQDNWRPI